MVTMLSTVLCSICPKSISKYSCILTPVSCTGVSFLPGSSSGSMAATPAPSRCTQ